MSEEIKKVKKMVEVESVEMTIEISEDFFKTVETAKKEVEDKTGKPFTYGEYVETAMVELVDMIELLQGKLVEASQIIQKQDEMLGSPEREDVEAFEKAEPVDPESGEVESEPPADLYAHLKENEEGDPMYG